MPNETGHLRNRVLRPQEPKPRKVTKAPHQPLANLTSRKGDRHEGTIGRIPLAQEGKIPLGKETFLFGKDGRPRDGSRDLVES